MHKTVGEGLAYLSRTPVDPNYRETIQNFLRNRESNFLALTKSVLERPDHPYAQLFEIAGCRYSDLEASVRRDGLEDTLAALLREGVYLTLDEFRCNTEIVRGGRHIRPAMTDWDLAAGKGPLQNISSGTSGGRGLRTQHSLQLANFGMAGGQLLLDEFHRGSVAPIIIHTILPSSAGLGSCMGTARLGHAPERWFTLGGSMRGNGPTALPTHPQSSPVSVWEAPKYPIRLICRKTISRRWRNSSRIARKQGVPAGITGMVGSIHAGGRCKPLDRTRHPRHFRLGHRRIFDRCQEERHGICRRGSIPNLCHYQNSVESKFALPSDEVDRAIASTSRAPALR